MIQGATAPFVVEKDMFDMKVKDVNKGRSSWMELPPLRDFNQVFDYLKYYLDLGYRVEISGGKSDEKK